MNRPQSDTKPQSAGQHSPEPWHYVTGNTFVSVQGDRADTVYLDTSPERNRPLIEANARRIVACVNAFHGVDDPQGELAGLRVECGERRFERDALRERVRGMEGALRTVQMAINEALTGFPRPITDYKDVVNYALRGRVVSAQRGTPRVDAIALRYPGKISRNQSVEQYNDLLDCARSLERDRCDLLDALRVLVDAVDVYAEPGNVAINQAWLPASELLARIEKETP